MEVRLPLFTTSDSCKAAVGITSHHRYRIRCEIIASFQPDPPLGIVRFDPLQAVMTYHDSNLEPEVWLHFLLGYLDTWGILFEVAVPSDAHHRTGRCTEFTSITMTTQFLAWSKF